MSRILIFGGSFDPVHQAHVDCARFVQKKMNFDEVIFVPNSQNPIKSAVELVDPRDRLEMVRLAISEDREIFSVDDSEVLRGGPSYSVDTVTEYVEKFGEGSVYFLLGLDAFERFDEWKEYSQILKICNLVVMSRSGRPLPRFLEDLPEGVRPFVGLFDHSFCALTTGRQIEFLQVPDWEVSSTELRKRLKAGRDVGHLMHPLVIDYMNEHKLYQPLDDRIGDIEEFVKRCAFQLKEKKALHLRAFDLRGSTAPADYVLIGSGTSTRHAKALGEHLSREIKLEHGVQPLSLEGLGEGRWVLLDYGVVIVHIFYDYVRSEYRLEDLWSQAREIPLSP